MLHHGALHVVVYHAGADVGGAGDVAGVAEPPRDVVDRRQHVLPGVPAVLRGAELGQLDRGDQGPGPRAEVLGGELLSHDLLDVGAQVARFDVPELARVVVVLEDLIPGQIAALFDHPPEPDVRDALALVLSPFTGEPENEGVPFDGQVLAPERGDAVGLVVLRVALIAETEVGRVHQAGHSREDLLTVQVLVPQVVAGDTPHLGQRGGEAQDPVELLSLLALPVLAVVEVLEPAGRVVAYGLHLRRRAPGYPGVLPGRRHLQVLYPGEYPLLAHRLARAGVRSV